MPSKISQLTAFLEEVGTRHEALDGLAIYHRAREALNANRKRDPLEKFAAVNHALKPFPVVVSLRQSKVRVFHPATKRTLYL